MPHSNYYHHLIFDNSLTGGGHYFSSAWSVQPSQIEAHDGKIPVSGDRFFSPPNCLRLSWVSGPGGAWQAEVYFERWRGRDPFLEGDGLSFWCYSEENISSDELPLVRFGLRSGARTEPIRLADIVPDLPSGRWTHIDLPWSAVPRTTADYDYSQLQAVHFMQSIDDGKPHTLYLDEIKVLRNPARAGHSGPPAPPDGLTARGYDRHIDLSWSPTALENIQYYQVYRSEDGQDYQPVGIQTPVFNRFTDYLGRTGVSASYRVTAVDWSYVESGPSPVAAAQTTPLSDEDLLSMVQEACFRYYWEAAHPQAGLALESIPGDENMVALGASGFGIMAGLAAVERGFISREAGLERLEKQLAFLENADRFFGVWPHFLDGRSGRALPVFGKYDNGGDLVETAFMIQGLLAARQFFSRPDPAEERLRQRITALWETVEWNRYRPDPSSPLLYWHWSPDHGFHISHPIVGWNETMIVYLLAIASPTHPVSPEMYWSGWASQSLEAVRYRQNWGQTTQGDHYANGSTYYGIRLPVGVGSGGPLFFTHYSFMGFDPRGWRDRYTDYFKNNRALSLINYRYCLENSGGYKGYGEGFWGLSASDDHTGYLPHEPSPRLDNGTISPTAAISSFPYTPLESMRALRHMYSTLGREIWGIYGFRDAYNPTQNYVSRIYMGLNQAPMVVMIENYRSGLVWKMFMSNPEIPEALTKIGFTRTAP
jgi:exo beta-1,2-glucooligosaccharide sophorohydrolase (non-reducing end)